MINLDDFVKQQKEITPPEHVRRLLAENVRRRIARPRHPHQVVRYALATVGMVIIGLIVFSDGEVPPQTQAVPSGDFQVSVMQLHDHTAVLLTPLDREVK
jgi:predicted anti-sigma-YlaC factor YlaD